HEHGARAGEQHAAGQIGRLGEACRRRLGRRRGTCISTFHTSIVTNRARSSAARPVSPMAAGGSPSRRQRSTLAARPRRCGRDSTGRRALARRRLRAAVRGRDSRDRTMKIRRYAIAAALLTLNAPALAADANAGRQAFGAQCALCHSAAPNDNGGAQGPSLIGILGRKAAASGGYGYSRALRESDLTWDEATLDRFLAAPTEVVPGSAMVVAVPSATDRENLIAYFAAVRDGTLQNAPPRPA